MAQVTGRILVTGGAGYIGSHMVKMLLDEGYKVTTLDNLENGFRDAVVGGEFIEGDIGDRSLLEDILGKEDFLGAMHFASYIQVGESVAEPDKYYRNNLCSSRNLLSCMVRQGVNNLIFSSSAAVYGEPRQVPIPEEHGLRPLSPYGRSKQMVEEILKDYDLAHGLKSISLRYFNAAGADPDGRLGERHEPETHLIPLVLQAASGRKESVTMFGNDYDTDDGTCIRDYIHVVDLCRAHLLALERLISEKKSGCYNLGNGRGYSVREVIETARQVTGREINVVEQERRPGDPAVLLADAAKAREELGWITLYSELGTIVEHSWQWEIGSAGETNKP